MKDTGALRIRENLRLRELETSELHLRLKHFIAECDRCAAQHQFQAELHESYAYGDEGSLALIQHKRHRYNVNTKAAQKARKLLDHLRGTP